MESSSSMALRCRLSSAVSWKDSCNFGCGFSIRNNNIIQVIWVWAGCLGSCRFEWIAPRPYRYVSIKNASHCFLGSSCLFRTWCWCGTECQRCSWSRIRVRNGRCWLSFCRGWTRCWVLRRVSFWFCFCCGKLGLADALILWGWLISFGWEGIEVLTWCEIHLSS